MACFLVVALSSFRGASKRGEGEGKGVCIDEGAIFHLNNVICLKAIIGLPFPPCPCPLPFPPFRRPPAPCPSPPAPCPS